MLQCDCLQRYQWKGIASLDPLRGCAHIRQPPRAHQPAKRDNPLPPGAQHQGMDGPASTFHPSLALQCR